MSDPSFEVPTRPTRRFSRTTVEYEGAVVFRCYPSDHPDPEALVRSVLDAGPYRYGDWFDLPMPLFLIHDDETGDTFRVAVRDGVVELHVLPATEPAGLQALYERLVARSDCSWTVERRVDPDVGDDTATG